MSQESGFTGSSAYTLLAWICQETKDILQKDSLDSFFFLIPFPFYVLIFVGRSHYSLVGKGLHHIYMVVFLKNNRSLGKITMFIMEYTL